MTGCEDEGQVMRGCEDEGQVMTGCEDEGQVMMGCEDQGPVMTGCEVEGQVMEVIHYRLTPRLRRTQETGTFSTFYNLQLYLMVKIFLKIKILR